jgi:ribosome maturation factor RimP
MFILSSIIEQMNSVHEFRLLRASLQSTLMSTILRITMSSDVAMVSSCRTQFNAIAIDDCYDVSIRLFDPIDHHDAIAFLVVNDCLVVWMVDRIQSNTLITIEEMIA